MPNVLSDTDGSPLVLYHGTAEAFPEFNKDRVGSRHADILREDCDDESVDPTAFYFTNDLATALWYAKSSAEKHGISQADGIVIAVSLSMDNAKKVDFHGEGREYLAEELVGAKQNGHDALICRDYDDGGVSDHYVVFDSRRITILRSQTVAEVEAALEGAEHADTSHADTSRSANRESA